MRSDEGFHEAVEFREQSATPAQAQEEPCPHGMRPEWCADCREREAKEQGCGTV